MTILSLFDILKLIAQRSPQASPLASKAIMSLSELGRQARFMMLAPIALGDEDAHWTAEERQAIGSFLDTPSKDGRNYTLRVRLTNAEMVIIQDLAEHNEMNISDYVRMVLLNRKEIK